MLKQLLSLASILFVCLCVGAILFQFVDDIPFWSYVQNLYHLFDNEGTLDIDSMPVGATVYINNKFIGQSPLTEKVSGGTYDVKLVLEGYQTFARRITIEKNNTAVVHAKLSKEYGILHVTSTPSNATVFINGKRQGQVTPLELKLPNGRYTVKVTKDKFYFFEEEVLVEQGHPFTIEADLVRQVGRLILETTPSGAKAYIGNDLIGVTPLTQDKPVGKYVITLKKPGFRDKIIETNVAPDEPLDIYIELAEQTGSLKITTTPPGAEVHINDAYQGETPIPIQKKPGAYRVLVKKDGYREISEEIVIEDNITKNIHRELEPILGEIRVDSPPNAKVWINSEFIGYTPIKSNRSPGIYTVRITRPGYRNFVQEVHIGKDGTFIQLNPELEKEL